MVKDFDVPSNLKITGPYRRLSKNCAMSKANVANTKTSGMSPLPNHRPRQLSLGPLETEVLEIVWQLGEVTVKDVHDRILADPDRELAYASVTTVLNRLVNKGWLACNQQGRSYRWYPLVNQEQAKVLQAYARLHEFLAVGNPDIVAAFADSLDQASLAQLEEIAQRIQALRQAREEL